MSNFILILFLGIIIFLIGYIVFIYNNFVTLKNNVKKSWANIDVLLKQRHDELPKLIDTCQGYMQYEQATLEKVTTLRNQAEKVRQQGDIAAVSQVEAMLNKSLTGLFALAENYPDLKANQSFVQLQDRISSIENAIADRREFYNDSVTLNNIRLEQFPELIVGKLFNFQKFAVLEFDPTEREDINVGNHFKH